jgi:hypothetical protein
MTQVLDYMYKDGREYESYGDEDDFLFGEGGEEEDLELLKAQLTEEQKAKLEAQGISIEDYLNGAGEDLEDDLYGDEGGEDDLYGDEDSQNEAKGGADKRAKTD